MRLTLTLPELEQGYSNQRGTNERIMELQFMAERKEPVAIAPLANHDGRIISAVLLTDCEEIGKSTSIKIKFRPFWCKVFTLCSYNKDSIMALVCQLQNGQFWVDHEGFRPCKLTLEGDGTDPRTVHHAQYVFGDLLSEKPRLFFLGEAIRLVQANC